jgi:hypothetical protein
MPRQDRILVGQAPESQRRRWQVSPKRPETADFGGNRNALGAFRDSVAGEVVRLIGSRIAA